ncbi:MAG TPA: DNA repair protein RadC [Candidatus Nanoarchaeia archaeon]|nr:DNA repair protein RadC [Candidatus Nanoarchaeia archaeon]
MKLLEIPLENRPRERFQKLGPAALSDAELLAIMLQKGTADENVIDISNRLISEYGLAKLPELSLKELQQISGIGPVKAIQLKAVFELNRRVSLAKNEKVIIKNAKDAFSYASGRLLSNDKEQFMVILLNSKNRIIKDEVVSVGTLNASLIHSREVFKSAIKESANAIIIAHNHPSGDPTPSEEDAIITNSLVDAGELLNIKLVDHVILGKNSYYSFAKEGRI